MQYLTSTCLFSFSPDGKCARFDSSLLSSRQRRGRTICRDVGTKRDRSHGGRVFNVFRDIPKRERDTPCPNSPSSPCPHSPPHPFADRRACSTHPPQETQRYPTPSPPLHPPPSISSSIPFDWDAARLRKPPPYGTPFVDRRLQALKNGGGRPTPNKSTPTKRVVRKKTLWQK
jgi:hypothetical protein